MIQWRYVALSIAVALGVSLGCGGQDEPAAGAPRAARKAAEAEPQAEPQFTEHQLDDHLARFSWNPAKGAERDKIEDSDDCREQIGELSPRQTKALHQIKEHIDCMTAKGWHYSS